MALCMILSGCNGKTERNEPVKSKAAEMEEIRNTEAPSKEQGDIFPKSYNNSTEKVKFECELEVPEKFKASEFCLPKEVELYNCLNKEAAYELFIGEQPVVEEYHYPQENGSAEEDIYILEDGTVLAFPSGADLNYHTETASVYQRVMREQEQGALKEDFSFGTGEEAVEKVKEILTETGYPVETYQFDWFSLSGKEHAELEQERLAQGSIGQESIKQDGWKEDENCYEIWAWQTYGGLPVLPQRMSAMNLRSFVNYQTAPLSAVYTEHGISGILAEMPYKIEAGEQQVKFLPFEEIAGKVISKYENLLDEAVYAVERAVLVLQVSYNTENRLIAVPAWYFEVDIENGDQEREILFFDAVSGEEIFIQ